MRTTQDMRHRLGMWTGAVVGFACLLTMLGCGDSWGTQPTSDEQPDLILYGGRVFTADPANLWAEAVSIRGERILAVGSDEIILASADSDSRLIDLGGRVVIPGINDTHSHMGYFAPIGEAIQVDNADWVQGPDPKLVLDSLAALARRTPPGTWLRGQMALHVRHSALRRAALDSVAPNHPVILVGSYGHGSMLNTRALRMIGVSDTMPDPVGGWYEREPGTRTITGLLDGSAQYDAWDAYWSSSPEGMTAELRRQSTEALQYGVTTIQHMGSLAKATATERFFRDAALPIRIRLIQWPFPGRLAEWQQIKDHRPSRLTYISGVKYVVDGTPIEQWALMRHPYEGTPGWHGRLYYPVDTIRSFLQVALAGEDQLMLHIVGDSTAAVVLGLMQELAADSVWQGRRVRFEHANGITGPNVGRARRLGIIISQPRADAAQMRMWHEAGIPLAHGADGPANPWQEFMLATTAPDTSQALSREDAMRMYTWGSAYAEFAEGEKGTLAPGMFADVAVLLQDIFAVPSEALPSTTSILTLVGGAVVYDAGVLNAEVPQ